MKEELKQLESLKEKIQSTWGLLQIDDMIAEMHGLEKEMETWTRMKDEVDQLISISVELEKEKDEAVETDVKKRAAELQKEFEKLEFFLLLNGKHDTENAIVAVHAGSE